MFGVVGSAMELSLVFFDPERIEGIVRVPSRYAPCVFSRKRGGSAPSSGFVMLWSALTLLSEYLLSTLFFLHLPYDYPFFWGLHDKNGWW
jgi:hypothetical protein